MADKDKHEINHKFVDVKRAQARGVAPPSIHQSRQQAGGQEALAAPTAAAAAAANKDELSPEQLHTKVFVGGIPPHIDSDELKRIFTEFGPVTDAIVMMDPVSQRSRCFGFVTFETGSDGAQRAIEKQPLTIDGRHVEVKLATPREGAQKRTGGGAGQPPPAPKHLGLRAGQSGGGTGEFAGLAVAYGRSGWKAGYGTRAFGRTGWAVPDWEDTVVTDKLPEKTGFSFSKLPPAPVEGEPPRKKARQ
jgi:RNA recognition motif-containing protein